MMNTIEAYGRGKSVDIHQEASRIIKGEPTPTSEPPPFKTRYASVWPTTVTARDGRKLVIGMETCNVLVTSSTRLDKALPACLGATATNFDLLAKEESMQCAIYLDADSVRKALAIARHTDATTASDASLYQLRQVNTKFNDASTYLLIRRPGHITRNCSNQPYSQ